MTITIQWIDCEGGHLESAEGRFVIRPEDGEFTLLERFTDWPEGGAEPVARVSACSFHTQEECQLWAHKRLAKYWGG